MVNTTNIFNSARIKLTASYVFILLLIILLFSFVLYEGAVMELRRSLRTQALRFVPRFDRLVPMSVETEPDEEVFAAARYRLLMQLVGIDSFIFAFSVAASYIIAGKTLGPIEEAMEKQKRFVSDASHELRTPLTAMRTEIEVMLREKRIDPDDAKKLLESNLEEIDKMRALSDYLLKLSRFDTTSHTLVMESVSLTGAVNQAIKNVHTLAKAKHIEITMTPPVSSTEYMMTGNKVSLVELCTILLENAIKYSHEEGKVDVSLTSTKKHLTLKISDQGIGIKSSEIPYIFNRFYRADSSRSKKQVDGFGLGLSIAKSIVNQHNGKIDVESEPGKGTTFILSFAQVS